MFIGDLDRSDVTELVNLLRQRGWQTRQQLCSTTAWNDRQIRKLAELAGSDIVRGPMGFNSFERAATPEIEHAAAIAESQGVKMLSYSKALRVRLLERISSPATTDVPPHDFTI